MLRYFFNKLLCTTFFSFTSNNTVFFLLNTWTSYSVKFHGSADSSIDLLDYTVWLHSACILESHLGYPAVSPEIFIGQARSTHSRVNTKIFCVNAACRLLVICEQLLSFLYAASATICFNFQMRYQKGCLDEERQKLRKNVMLNSMPRRLSFDHWKTRKFWKFPEKNYRPQTCMVFVCNSERPDIRFELIQPAEKEFTDCFTVIAIGYNVRATLVTIRDMNVYQN